MRVLPIKLIPGDQDPKYANFEGELSVKQVNITEQGTVGNLPIVDLVCESPSGEKYLIVITGREANAISAAVKGVNMRNHGVAEP